MPKVPLGVIGPIWGRQRGLVMRSQLVGLGLSESAIDHRITRGLLEVVQPSVYRFPGDPGSWEQRILAALLAAGDDSVLSHLAAAREWRFEGVDCDRPHILLAHERRLDLLEVEVHRTRRLADGDVTRRRGIRLTTPARTLMDIAGLVTFDVLERALDDALRRRIVTLAKIRLCLDQRGPNGIRGWGRLDRLVRERQGTEPTGSGKETTFLRGLRRRGLPVPVKQFRIVDAHGRFIARPDFSYPELKLAIEIDSGFHLNPRQRRRDLRRQNAMTVQGWRCLYFDNNDRAGQHEAFETIEAAFGEPNLNRSPVGLPKRRKRNPRT